MNKDFESWNKLKQEIDNIKELNLFKERDVWWCSIGMNIGHEAYGKGAEFNRPILIVKKFSKRLFWGIPLTTQLKDNKHYYKLEFTDKTQCAMLTQMKLIDSSRLNERMGRLPNKPFNDIKRRLIKYLEE